MDATTINNKIYGKGGTKNSKMLKARWKHMDQQSLLCTYNLFRRGGNSHSCKGRRRKVVTST
jgi:hypothetical protein